MITEHKDLQQRLKRLGTDAPAARAKLETVVRVGDRDLKLYRAGLREGQVRFGLFGRDLLITALLVKEPGFSRDALRFVDATLGTRCDARTGEEPGRGLHEFDDVEMRGLSTRYNASEVSLLFLVAAAEYMANTENAGLIHEIAEGLKAAVEYLVCHCDDGLFLEDPAKCGAPSYALRATYWKDDHLPGRDDPAYPVAYTLVQALAVAAFRAAAKLVKHLPGVPAPRSALTSMANRAVERLLADLWNPVLDYPVIALDRDGPIPGVSSDALHMLAYLEAGDIPKERLAAIEGGAEALVTPFGYRTYARGQVDHDPHAYHLGAIWPFEQAMIARGAACHGLSAARDVALQVVDALEALGFHELFYWDQETGLEGANAVDGQGCDLQLWSLAVPAALLSVIDGK